MAFRRHRGKTKIMYFKGDTALQVRDGGVVSLNDSGFLTPARNDSTDRIIGVARRNDSTTDSALVPVEVPVEMAVEWLIDVDSDAGAADTDIGRYCAVDTTGGNSVLAGDSCGMRVDISDTAVPAVYVSGRVSATQVIGVLAKSAFVRTFDTADTSG